MGYATPFPFLSTIIFAFPQLSATLTLPVTFHSDGTTTNKEVALKAPGRAKARLHPIIIWDVLLEVPASCENPPNICTTLIMSDG
ncbi:hypothetical protein L218DRAFT_1004374 [Marasmius fiardii PR-910]|nr:hypothetical protein L218DRAFT_1004374 [Marasmius fiardii PR-910]